MRSEEARLRVRALGRVIDLGVRASAVERLRSQWSRCLVTDAVPSDESVDLGRTDGPGYDYAAATQVVTSALLLHGPDRLHLHAAGLSDAGGRVLTLVAASGTGKTTASARLGRALGYVTDECVSVDPETFAVLPLPKPLAVRRPLPDDAGHKDLLGPDQLGLAPCADDLRLGPIVLLDRRREIATPRLERVNLTTALLELIPHTSALPRMRHPLRVLAEAVRHAGGVRRLVYADIEDALPLLHDLLETAPVDDLGHPITHLPSPGPLPDPTSGPAPGPPPSGVLPERVRRAPWTDALRVGDRVLVLIGTQPFLLSGLGAALWLAAGEAARVTVLDDQPDADRAIRQAAIDLLAAGLLEQANAGSAQPLVAEEKIQLVK